MAGYYNFADIKKHVNKANRVTIGYPLVPYWGFIPGGLKVGKLIEINGSVPFGADVFHINFVCGQDEGSTCADRMLHISVRFSGRVVVRNSMQKNKWEDEERSGGFPFEVGKKFMMMILVDNDYFQIAVNGKHQWDFRHRVAFSRANMLHISGTVKLDEIQYLTAPVCTPAKSSPDPCYVLEPILNPKIPYVFPIHEGLKHGTMIYISGKPSINAQRFTFNLQCDTTPYPSSQDIAFHFDVRMFNSSLVRNTRVNEKWGREEIGYPYFPFQNGVFFDLIVRVEGDKFMLAVGGQHFLEFFHRLFPLNKVNVLNIEGDVIITSIRVAF